MTSEKIYSYEISVDPERVLIEGKLTTQDFTELVHYFSIRGYVYIEAYFSSLADFSARIILSKNFE